jgi:hypothetical protein
VRPTADTFFGSDFDADACDFDTFFTASGCALLFGDFFAATAEPFASFARGDAVTSSNGARKRAVWLFAL